ncbi:MAG: hypothetical protein PVF82_19160 [Gammaproteobacteria bacterium]|jgi:hypothetical protein
MPRLLFVWILIFPLVALADTGSKLEHFEKDATSPRPSDESDDPPPQQDQHQSGSNFSTENSDETQTQSNFGDDLALALIQAIPLAMVAGGRYSWERVSVSAADDGANGRDRKKITPKAPGEGVVPYIRLDASYNHVDDRIHASDYRAEVGYGPFGFEYRQVLYGETNPEATLELEQYHALYRMSFGDRVEIDLGYGRLDLIGMARHSGSSWTLPILIHPSPHFGIEYRPSWAKINGNSISNQELAISVGAQFWAFRGGYHWLESHEERLSGPFIGLSLRF